MSDAAVTVRKAAAGDVDGILALVNSNTDRLLARDRDEIASLLDTFWVADDGGDIVGCCCLEVYSPKIAELRSLAVRPSHRGRGLGAALTTQAVEEAERRGIPQVLVVTSNREFFERLNFGPCLNEKYALFWINPDAPPGVRP
jgi:N-acetylglutamate synthase-like GNAT family acetyltransferase